MKWHWLLILAVLVVLAGCNTQEALESIQTEKPRWIKIADSPQSYGLHRIIDEDAGVVCWVAAHYRSGGISCLPLSDTNLAE